MAENKRANKKLKRNRYDNTNTNNSIYTSSVHNSQLRNRKDNRVDI